MTSDSQSESGGVVSTTALLGGWLDISTAPKGMPANGYASEWFLAYGNQYKHMNRIAVIKRHNQDYGFGPWEGTGEEFYKADAFTHWMPLPEPPNAKLTDRRD